MFNNSEKVSAGIAGRRSVLTRTVVLRDDSRMHGPILHLVWGSYKTTHMNSRDRRTA
ncbi:hypothetical protein APS58_p00048 (plasmid) [Paracidovorax citrulli]|nr:hypothetical protein APS58_p00048 [Paracidovorax citrulli]